MAMHAHASVAAYICCCGVRTAASQLAQALGLRDPLAEDYGGHLAQALLLDAPVGYYALQVDEAALAEVAQHMQRAYVALDIGPDLYDVGVAQYGEQRVVQLHAAEADQVAALVRRELQQRHLVHLPGLERGTGLCVEPYDALRCEILAYALDLLVAVDDHYLAVEMGCRQLCRLLV